MRCQCTHCFSLLCRCLALLRCAWPLRNIAKPCLAFSLPSPAMPSKSFALPCLAMRCPCDAWLITAPQRLCCWLPCSAYPLPCSAYPLPCFSSPYHAVAQHSVSVPCSASAMLRQVLLGSSNAAPCPAPLRFSAAFDVISPLCLTVAERISAEHCFSFASHFASSLCHCYAWLRSTAHSYAFAKPRTAPLIRCFFAYYALFRASFGR